MTDYIFIRKSRNKLSSFLHVLLNLLLGVGSVLITVISGSWVLGVILVFLSKWRIFAVRPRFWFLNIKSNLVDLIIGISFVYLTYQLGTELLPAHFVFAGLYSIWLIFLKPRSSKNAAITQAIISMLLGFSATTLLTATSNSVFLIILSFIIGYGASRHVLTQTSEKDSSFITVICGLLCAEVSWLSYSWTIIYTFSNSGIVLPQLALILTIAMFGFIKIISSADKNDGKLKAKEVFFPAIFSVLTILIIIFGFSNPIFNI